MNDEVESTEAVLGAIFLVLAALIFLAVIYYGWPVTAYLLGALFLALMCAGLKEQKRENQQPLQASIFESAGWAFLSIGVGIGLVALIQTIYYISPIEIKNTTIFEIQDLLSQSRIYINENIGGREIIIYAIIMFAAILLTKSMILNWINRRLLGFLSFLSLFLLAATSFTFVGTNYVDRLERGWRWQPVKDLQSALEQDREGRSNIVALAWVEHRFGQLSDDEKHGLADILNSLGNGSLHPNSDTNDGDAPVPGFKTYLDHFTRILASKAIHRISGRTTTKAGTSFGLELNSKTIHELRVETSNRPLGQIREMTEQYNSRAKSVGTARLLASEIVVNSLKLALPEVPQNIVVEFVGELSGKIASTVLKEADFRSVRKFEDARRWVAEKASIGGSVPDSRLRWTVSIGEYAGSKGIERLKLRIGRDIADANEWSRQYRRWQRSIIEGFWRGRGIGQIHRVPPRPQVRPSDIRLKHNIQFVQRLSREINLYRFKYRGEEGFHLGVLAQELIASDKHRHAVEMLPTGYYAVDYYGLYSTIFPEMMQTAPDFDQSTR